MGPELSLTLLICLALTTVVLVLAGAVDRHRVCEHGLALGWRSRTPLIVPWSTLDPGRVRVVERSGLVGRRHDTPASSPHFRTGLLVTRALSINGIDSAHGGWIDLPGLLGVVDTVDHALQEQVTLPWNPDQDGPHPLPYRGSTDAPIGV